MISPRILYCIYTFTAVALTGKKKGGGGDSTYTSLSYPFSNISGSWKYECELCVVKSSKGIGEL